MRPQNKTSEKKLGTLLVLSTYPIRKPRHGGQLRSAALMAEYEKAFNKVVRTAVFNSTVYSRKEYGKHDIPSPAVLSAEIVQTPELEAWFLGESPVTTADVKAKISQLLEKLKPDVIVFEQVYLYLGMKVLLEELGLKIPVIYSSHNVETEMMQEIFATQNKLRDFTPQLQQLENAEKHLAQTATGVIAVSENDAQVFESWGARDVLVQGNGTSPKTNSFLKRLRVRRIMKKLNVTSYALLVASSHRPNVDGFIKMLGTRLGYLPENSMIFIAGDLGRALHPVLSSEDPRWNNLFWNRVYNWDRVSSATLSALLSEATCIILPITSGGGSNLKTAEAINSGKPVIATTISMRGFSQTTNPEQILICDNPIIFKNTISEILSGYRASEREKKDNVRDILWGNQMYSVTKWLRDISKNV